MQNLKLPHQRLKYILDYLHLTRKQVAQDTDTEYTVVCRYLNGNLLIKEKFAKKIQDVYHVSSEWLLTGEGLQFLEETNLNEYNQRIDTALAKVDKAMDDLFELKVSLTELKNTFNSAK